MSGVSSHGTIIARAPANNPQVFEDIAELGDIQMPGLSRNEFDTSSHNDDIDKYILGILRRDPVTFPMFFNKAVASHQKLQQAILDNTTDGYRITEPDGTIWICSGNVQAIKQTAPVDGVKTADVTIRLTGAFFLNGILASGN